ncbi:MAG: ABC transporter ATP-binding protein/permease [Treponema sp.]|jgi:ATP-binding cassette subfamily B protein|nr:ABC transporter ATP-binding protein/permease [Treponema sp.]
MRLPWKGSRFKLVASAAEGRKLRFFICCAATLGAVALSFLNPQIVRYTIDSVIGDMPLSAPEFVHKIVEGIGGLSRLKQNIWICALFVLAAALLSGLFDLVRSFISIEIGETAAWKLRNTLYSHIQKLPYNWHIGCQTGDIIQRCTTDVDNIRNFIQWQLNELMRTACIFVTAVTIMFSMDVFMSLMSLVLIPGILVFSILYFRRVSREFGKADATEGIMQAAAQENYTGVRVVRAFGRESHEMEKFSQKTKAYQDIWNYIGKMLGVFWGAGDFFSGFQLVIILGAGVWRTVQGNLSPGTFLAFYAYCNWMIWPVRQLGRILADLSKTMVAAGRVRDILATEPETDPADALTPEIKGEICFTNVSFNYGKEPVLRGINFSLKPGESLAILGATGSGKSTMVHLLSRLYDLKDADGLITIDGVDIRKINRYHLRRHIGLCLQEPFLFSKTIRENISIANPEMELAELRAAASVAMIDETIMGFAETYNTLIGERGVTISGGQKQRVAITRMLVGNTPVIIFDDSLSAVDTGTDAKIRAALRGRVKDAAVIIISHRISSLMQADKILVLKDGTVEEIGSHEELLKNDGSYRRIFELQRGMAEEE